RRVGPCRGGGGGEGSGLHPPPPLREPGAHPGPPGGSPRGGQRGEAPDGVTSRIARQIRSGVSGRSRTTAPVASLTAEATAAATHRRPPSPSLLAPKGPGPSPFSTMIDSSWSGTSL